jgi:hypothetical protein
LILIDAARAGKWKVPPSPNNIIATIQAISIHSAAEQSNHPL